MNLNRPINLFLFHGGTQTSTEFTTNLNSVTNEFLKFPENFNAIIPQAKTMPYTARKGELKHIWFDRVRNTINEPENLEGMDETCEDLIKNHPQLLDEKLILGGYSMGGSLALYLGLKFLPEHFGVRPLKIFTMSSYLNRNSLVYAEKTGQDKILRTPIYMCHAKNDPIVPFSSGQETFDLLKKAGFKNLSFRTNNSYHFFDEQQLIDVKRFCLLIYKKKMLLKQFNL